MWELEEKGGGIAGTALVVCKNMAWILDDKPHSLIPHPGEWRYGRYGILSFYHKPLEAVTLCEHCKKVRLDTEYMLPETERNLNVFGWKVFQSF